MLKELTKHPEWCPIARAARFGIARIRRWRRLMLTFRKPFLFVAKYAQLFFNRPQFLLFRGPLGCHTTRRCRARLPEPTPAPTHGQRHTTGDTLPPMRQPNQGLLAPRC